MLRQGHRLTLYGYDRPDGVPDGVEIADAAAILPRQRVIRHRGGSPSLFSNLFRYELQRRGLGTWIDSDVYLLAPLDGERPYLFGLEAPGVINGAVLRLPPDSPMLPPLIALFDELDVPLWLPWRSWLGARWRLAARGRTGLADMPWGSAGPRALSWTAARLGLPTGRFPAKSSIRCRGSRPNGFAIRPPRPAEFRSRSSSHRRGRPSSSFSADRRGCGRASGRECFGGCSRTATSAGIAPASALSPGPCGPRRARPR
ncbi:MAG TPA: hypothetical protein VF759_00675 [Allosphingosinicella sp.]